jgi:IS30 family transposase
LATRPRLRNCVISKLKQNWSPQQIAGWLRREFVDDLAMQVSHETIYRTLFVQPRNALKKELLGHLRTHRAHRQPKKSKKGHTSSIVDGISIRERPAEVEDRAVPGHWEGDLLFGTVHNYIATLVERHSRFVMLVKVPSKDTETVTAALQKQIVKLPEELRLSLTWDRGSEMSGHKEFVVATGIPVYFCDPHSPWQRGSNENTNGLLRQYFPKGKDVSHYSQADLNKVARQLNGRPRKTLDYRTPAEALTEALR